jgi:hypothetical protein
MLLIRFRPLLYGGRVVYILYLTLNLGDFPSEGLRYQTAMGMRCPWARCFRSPLESL